MASEKLSKVSKLDVYLAYNDHGALKRIVKDYAISHNLTITKLVVDALRIAYPDLKI